jgi:hypothetical protein
VSANGGRFSAYLPAERELLAQRAKEEGSSENWLVRLGVRVVLGLPIPERDRRRLRESLEQDES